MSIVWRQNLYDNQWRRVGYRLQTPAYEDGNIRDAVHVRCNLHPQFRRNEKAVRLPQAFEACREYGLNSRVSQIWHAALDNLTMDELGVMLKRHAQIILCPNLGFGGHLFEA